MSHDTFRVSEHAVLRYLECAMGFKIEAVRLHIAGICQGPAAIGAICVRTERVRFEITNNTVTTVTPDQAQPNRTSRQRSQYAIERKQRAEA